MSIAGKETLYIVHYLFLNHLYNRNMHTPQWQEALFPDEAYSMTPTSQSALKTITENAQNESLLPVVSQYEGPLRVLHTMMVDPNCVIKKPGGKDLHVTNGEVVDIIQLTNSKKALCCNQCGKCMQTLHILLILIWLVNLMPCFWLCEAVLAARTKPNVNNSLFSYVFFIITWQELNDYANLPSVHDSVWHNVCFVLTLTDGYVSRALLLPM